MTDSTSKIAAVFDLSTPALPDLAHSSLSDNQSADSDGEKFVVFFLGEELFAIAAQEVIEIVCPPALTPLPGAPAWLCGIANWRGEIISILNLSKLCGKSTTQPSPKTKQIVLKPEIFDSSVAFLVDKVSEIITLTNEAIKPAAGNLPPYFFGAAAHKSGSVYLLDTKMLFSTLAISS
jgi:purine-binding chemotaxis protein CheW